MEVVAPDHELLEGIRAGRAVVYESGRSVIFISSRIDPDSALFRIVVDHETSHIEAWRRHGINIPEHGPRWLRVCREINPNACETDVEIPR